MRLTFIHGMNQQGKSIDSLRKDWQEPLEEAWCKAQSPRPEYILEMPYYGDELNNLAREFRASSTDVTKRGPNEKDRFSEFQKGLLVELYEKANLSAEEIWGDAAELIAERGPFNSEWILGIYRALERKFPRLGDIGLRFLDQVDAYLTHPSIRKKVDALIRPSLLDQPTVVVAHSLGTIASYNILREARAEAQVPLFITLGSPLGFDIVKRYIRPPSLMVPEGVAHWLNASNKEDYVALYPQLDRKSFAANIENISDVFSIADDPHAVSEYIADAVVSKRIYDALSVDQC